MLIKYLLVKEFIGWNAAEVFIKELILAHNLNSILEIGAGANPTIKPEFIEKHKLKYTVSDVAEEELNKAADVYNKLIVDFSNDVDISEKFDLVFSRMVGEHISNGETFHKNIYNILNEGGLSFHCFSTLYSFPFIMNKFLPEKLSDLLLARVAPRDQFQHGKFKAHYDWCRGPSKRMINRYKEIGYDIIEYVGYFGHNYYKKFSLLNSLEKIKSKTLKKHAIPYLTAYAHILLKK